MASNIIYARGRIEPPNLDALKAESDRKHGHILRALQGMVSPPPAYDCRTLTPQFVATLEDTDDNQSQCGSCWDFSGTVTAEAAMMKAGFLTPTQRLCKQYTLDCGRNGGCGGDDNTNVLDWAVKTGLPLASDYGSYQGSSGRCKVTSSMKLYKLDSWGFADANGGNGVTPTDQIKTAILAYGLVGCAVAAGSDWDGVGPGSIISGHSSSIDHDVALVGWDDSKGSKGAWIMRNSWGPGWGDGGYCWIEYGADSIGTETVFAIVKGPIPPPIPLVLDWLV